MSTPSDDSTATTGAEPPIHSDPPTAAHLAPTYFIDSEHPDIVALAQRARDTATGERAVISQLFVAIRDGILYDPYTIDYDPAHYTGSSALQRGRSFCIPKAIAYAAVLRAAGIPARLGFADVTNHLSTQRLLETLGTNVFAFHGYTEVWHGGRWWKATPAFNARLCARFGVPPLAFDATADAVLQPYAGGGQRFMEYLRDRGHFDDFPFEEMKRVFVELYPSVREALAASDGSSAPRDFEAEAIAERAGG